MAVAEHLQGQVAVSVIVGMEEPFLLESVQGRVRGVKVQHQRHRSGQSQSPVHLVEQLDYAVAVDVATAVISFYLAAFNGRKPDGIGETFCHGKVSFDVSVSN